MKNAERMQDAEDRNKCRKFIAKQLELLPIAVKASILKCLREITPSPYTIKNDEVAMRVFSDVKVPFDLKVDALYRSLLKEIISLFNQGQTEKALNLFDKLPVELKEDINPLDIKRLVVNFFSNKRKELIAKFSGNVEKAQTASTQEEELALLEKIKNIQNYLNKTQKSKSLGIRQNSFESLYELLFFFSLPTVHFILASSDSITVGSDQTPLRASTL